jgi:hypothetical protein
MLQLHKSYVVDENQHPIAVQIPVEEFKQIEEILEDVALAQLMDDTEDNEPLTKAEALQYYQSIKQKHVDC